MTNLNRRYAEALEKLARAEKRSAAADETIAKHLKEFLDDDELPVEGKQAPPSKNVPPQKNQPSRK